MTPEQWDQLEYFNRSENWGTPEKMRFELLWLLDRFRDRIGRPCIITYGTQGKHVKNSEHYKGNAVDFVLVLRGVSKLDALLELMRFPFTGVGVYPHWKYTYKGNTEVLGFHVDGREVSALPQGMVQARWIGVDWCSECNKDLVLCKCAGAQVKVTKYVDFSEVNLRKYGVING